MMLSQVLNDLKYDLYGEDKPITSVEYDSRNVKEGSLFVAIKGYGTDGHQYIEEAKQKGAAAVLCEVRVENTPDFSVAVTENTRIGLACASHNFYDNSAGRLKIIGVTGTNGKTTTTYLIKQVLALRGYKVGLIGTNQNMIGDRVIGADRTTPESLEICKIFKQMENEGVTHVVMEVSSHSLDLYRTYGINFEAGIFTNLTQDHLDFHKTMENYLRAKAKLFRSCKIGFINADDAYADDIINLAGCKTETYGTKDGCTYKAENIRLRDRSVLFTIEIGKKQYEVRLMIPGKFSVYNALAAACACLSLGVDIEDVIKGLVIVQGVRGRVEVVPLAAPYTVLIDYAHTPDGLENVLNAVKSFANGKIITVFGCGGDRDRSKRPVMGEIAGRLSDFCVVTSDNPRTEEPLSIINDILKGMNDYTDKYTVIADRTTAIEHAMIIAGENDVVLLAGKGHETYQILKDKTIDFDERVIVKEIFSRIKG